MNKLNKCSRTSLKKITTLKWNKTSSSVFLFLCLILLYSCFSDNEAKKKLVSENNASENVAVDENLSDEELDMADYSEEDIQDTIVNESLLANNDSDNIIKIKKALNLGNYKKVIKLSANEDSFEGTYYSGIAYFIMTLQKSLHSTEERNMYRKNAIANLSKVGHESPREDLKARGLLWYGVLIHLSYVDLEHKKKTIGAFYKIESTILKDTKYYNDAIYYSGLTYLQMGWYGVARNYFKRLANSDIVDDQIYDYTDNQYYSVSDASQKGLNKLKALMKK